MLTNEKYNTVRNFTHYIKPGDRLVASSNAQSTAAIDADGTGATVVHVNSETADRTVEIDLKDFGTVAANATVTPIVTTQSTAENPTVNALKQGAPVAVNPATKTATITVPGAIGHHVRHRRGLRCRRHAAAFRNDSPFS